MHVLAAVLPSLVLSLAPASSASPPPETALWTDDGTVLEIPLAHRDRDRIDAGILRVDRRRGVLTWKGLPEEIGCALDLEMALTDVREVAESRAVGLTLTLRSGPVRELLLMPPAHYALLAQPTVRKRGGIGREEAIASGLRNDNGEGYADAAGAGAFGGPTSKAIAVPAAVRRDVRAVVTVLRSALDVEP